MFVDDEELLLQGIKRVLRSKYELVMFTRAVDALEYLNDNSKVKPKVIVSDYKMPEMDGAKFLAEAKKILPDVSRILLTGQADINATIKIVNSGQIFRFLIKPCPNDVLIKAIEDGIRQTDLIRAEKELLSQTLKGTVKLLIDLLAVLYPKAYRRADHLRYICKKVAQRLKLQNIWEIEITALLSTIGLITLPNEIVEKKLSNVKLTKDEQILYDTNAEIAYSLINNIPRLSNIAKAILETNNKDFNPNQISFGNILPPELIGNLIALINYYIDLETSGLTTKQIIEELEKRKNFYNEILLSALISDFSGLAESFIIENVSLKELPVNCQLADNILDEDDRVLVSKGMFVTEIIRQKLINFQKYKSIKEPIKILKKV